MIQINEIGRYSVVKGDLKFDYIMDGDIQVGKFKWQHKDEFVEVVEPVSSEPEFTGKFK